MLLTQLVSVLVGIGHNVKRIYSENLISTTGIGTSAIADVTVNSLGEAENINIRRVVDFMQLEIHLL